MREHNARIGSDIVFPIIELSQLFLEEDVEARKSKPTLGRFNNRELLEFERDDALD